MSKSIMAAPIGAPVTRCRSPGHQREVFVHSIGIATTSGSVRNRVSFRRNQVQAKGCHPRLSLSLDTSAEKSPPSERLSWTNGPGRPAHGAGNYEASEWTQIAL